MWKVAAAGDMGTSKITFIAPNMDAKFTRTSIRLVPHEYFIHLRYDKQWKRRLFFFFFFFFFWLATLQIQDVNTPYTYL